MQDVAVIIPVFNRPQAIIDALASVAKQDPPPKCVVVVDDGSTDDTAEYVERWIAEAAPAFDCRLIRQPNGGVSEARNRGVEAADGSEWLAFLDSDDVWPDDFLTRMLAALDAETDAVAASTGRLIQDDRTGRTTRSVFDAPGELDTAAIFTSGPPGTSNTIIRRSAFDAIGGFETAERCGEDYQLFLRLTLRGRWLTVPGEPVLYRRNAYHAAVPTRQLSAAYMDRRYRLASILDRFLEEGGRDHVPDAVWRKRLGRIWYSAGRQLMRLGRHAQAAACFERAVRVYPQHLRGHFAVAFRSPKLSPVDHEGVRVYRNVGAEQALDAAGIVRLVDQAQATAESSADLLKEEAGGRVAIVGDPPSRFVVKLYGVGRLKAFVYQQVKRTRAWRECRGAAALNAARVRVAEPLALVDRPSGGSWSQALVLPLIEGVSLADWLAAGDATEEQRRAVFAAVGRQFGSLTRNGLVNRDHKSANIMIDPGALDAEPTVIDPAGIRSRSDTRVRRMASLLRETTLRYPCVTAEDVALCFDAAREVDPTLPELSDGQ